MLVIQAAFPAASPTEPPAAGQSCRGRSLLCPSSSHWSMQEEQRRMTDVSSEPLINYCCCLWSKVAVISADRMFANNSSFFPRACACTARDEQEGRCCCCCCFLRLTAVSFGFWWFDTMLVSFRQASQNSWDQRL